MQYLSWLEMFPRYYIMRQQYTFGPLALKWLCWDDRGRKVWDDDIGWGIRNISKISTNIWKQLCNYAGEFIKSWSS